jgi:hypothetical protein
VLYHMMEGFIEIGEENIIPNTFDNECQNPQN